MALLLSKLHSLHDPTAILVAVPVSIVIMVGASLSLRAHSLLRRDRELVVHSYQVITTSDRLLLSLADAETGQRGYLITADLAFLAPYTAATGGAVSQELQDLQSLLADNPDQKERLLELRQHSNEKLSELAASLALFQKGGFSAAKPLIVSHAGKNEMDTIRRITHDIETREQVLVRNRSENVHRDERQIIHVAITTTLVSTLLRIAIALWRRTRMAQRMVGTGQS